MVCYKIGSTGQKLGENEMELNQTNDKMFIKNITKTFERKHGQNVNNSFQFNNYSAAFDLSIPDGVVLVMCSISVNHDQMMMLNMVRQTSVHGPKAWIVAGDC